MIYWNKNDLIYLPFWIFMSFLIALVLWIFLKDKTKKIKMIPLMVITTIMLILELVKQILSIINGYDLYHIPLHFCSLFLYFYPLMVFTKGKLYDFGKTISFIASFLMFFVYLCAPSIIIGKDAVINMFTSYSAFHTLVYHNFVILFLFIGLFLNLFELKISDYKFGVLAITLYGAVAVPMAHILKVNFCDILYNNFEPLAKIRAAIGSFWFLTLEYLVAVLGVTIIFFIKYGIDKLIINKKNKENLWKKQKNNQL